MRPSGSHLSPGRGLLRVLSCLVLVVALLTAGCVGPVGTGSGSSEADSREIDHAAGNTTLEGAPERVVALEWNLVEDLLAVGIQPVGVADPDGYERWVNAEPALEENVTDVGTRQEPSLETIADLDPDLVLGVEFRHAEIYDQLSKIAPTLLFDPYPGPEGPSQYDRVMDNFQTVAEAVDREEQAQATLDALNQTFEEAQTRLEEEGGTEHPIVLAQAFTQEGSPTLRVFTDDALAVQALQRVGLENAWEGEFQPYGFATVGLEALERVEEASFLYVAQPDDDPVNGTFADDPAWRNLTFVQEDRVYPLGADVWLFGGPLSVAYTVEATVDALVSGGENPER